MKRWALLLWFVLLEPVPNEWIRITYADGRVRDLEVAYCQRDDWMLYCYRDVGGEAVRIWGGPVPNIASIEPLKKKRN